jgi:type II secretory pathway pseudopilin PulG
MRRDHGFTYLGLLFAVALSAGGLAVAASLWSTEAKRDREAELLFVGQQIRSAIGAYRDEAPAGQPHVFPRSLDDLVDDKRWPTRRRHLRKVFIDPMTGSPEWGIVQGPGGSVMGVFSLSQAAPLKRGGFAARDSDFADAASYRDWQFVYTPPAVLPGAPAAARKGAGGN